MAGVLPMVVPSPTLETIPPEVLEQIAYFVATSELKGPPSHLPALCCTSKAIHLAVCFGGNPALYAAIFRFKFDAAAPIRRLGPEHTAAPSLAAELRRRFQGLNRIRAGVGSRALENAHHESMGDLWMAVLMMLENDGKNALQLKEYAIVEQWLMNFVLDYLGASNISKDMDANRWPQDNDHNSLAIWLLWLCDAEGHCAESATVRRSYSEVLRAYALGATRYPLTQHPWNDFSPAPTNAGSDYTHYSLSFVPIIPPISIFTILGYILRMKEPRSMIYASGQGISSPRASQSSDSDDCAFRLHEHVDGTSTVSIPFSQQWDCDWQRCIGPTLGINCLERFHLPGSLDGTWEGLFTYTEFSVYAAILSGGPPQVLGDGAIGHNHQVWRLREYNFSSSPDSSSNPVRGGLPPGEALDAFFPPTRVEEKEDHAIFTHASKEIIYSRAPRPAKCGVEMGRQRLCDVIVLGEGHSSWGNFKLRGRIRATDAFVTIMKEYNGADDRGRWLYRGYLVGGRLAGRWRDAFSPLNLNGYEGSFELGRRV